MASGQPCEAFAFAFEPPLDTWARWFGTVPTRTFVRIDDDGLEAVYGLWRVGTTWSNVSRVERTGPYRAWKVAGPVHMSWSDRGITMAATTAEGVCLSLHEPVPGIDPFGLIRHPAMTLGVEDVDGFLDAVQLRRDFATERDESACAPHHDRGRLGGSLRALRNWRKRDVDIAEHDVDHVRFPAHDRAHDIDDQPREIGVGPVFHRTYEIEVDAANRSPEEAMAMIRSDLNLLADPSFAPVTKSRGRSDAMVVGDRYVIQLAGPWKGAVEVIEVTPCTFRFATLEGHMESGLIEMRACEADGGGRRVRFTVESWARSHDRAFDLIYNKIGLARALQGEMWAIACERFVDIIGGIPDGPLQITTERGANGQ